MPAARSEIIINASLEQVWGVMLDIDKYREWNPFVEHIECADTPPVLGSDLTLHVAFSNGMKRQEIERITRLEVPGEQGQAALQYQFTGPLSDWNLVRGQRLQTLVAISPQETRYVSYENLTGWLSWLAPMKQVRDGFKRHAQALKQRCEQQS
ncbi:MAG: SRPBCC domain-containing protein [Oceanococcus sp.]